MRIRLPSPNTEGRPRFYEDMEELEARERVHLSPRRWAGEGRKWNVFTNPDSAGRGCPWQTTMLQSSPEKVKWSSLVTIQLERCLAKIGTPILRLGTDPHGVSAPQVHDDDRRFFARPDLTSCESASPS